MYKRKLDAATWQGLNDTEKKLYKLVGTEYVLNLDGDDDGALSRANDRLKLEVDGFKTQLTAANTQLQTLQEKFDAVDTDKARKAGDVVALEASYKAKLADKDKLHEAERTKLNASLQSVLIEGVANSIAAEISTSPELIAPLIMKRLSADISGDKPITRVLDGNGQASALSVDELKKEFVDNKKYSGILIGTKASGGADGSRIGGSGGSASQTTLDQFKSMGDAKRTELYKSDPESFKRLSEESRLAVRRM